MQFCVDSNHCHIGTYLTTQSHSPGGATFPACWRSHCSWQWLRSLQRVVCGYNVECRLSSWFLWTLWSGQ